jgi:subtilisin family serine protease
MKKYVILRRPAHVVRSGSRSYRQTLHTPAPEVEFERLSDRGATDLARDPDIVAVAPAMKTRLIAPFRSDAGGAEPDAWGLDAVGARASRFSGAGVTVAVLDTGIDLDHPAFAGMNIEQKDFSGWGDGDRLGHGTHCAGTIFGRDVDGQRIGVARGVTQALIGKVLGDDGGGDTEAIVQGVNWAIERRADIISMSLGFDFPAMVRDWSDDGWPIELATSNALDAFRVNLRVFDAVMGLTRARSGLGGGALVVAASGNESLRDVDPTWKISTSLPAAADDVLAVAAVGRGADGLQVAPFSNTSAIVSGPGVDIVSAKSGGGLEALSGTSMAGPHVAGVAALWWESIRTAGRTPSPLNVKAQLIAGARRDVFAPPAAEDDIGQGLIVAP